MILAIGPTGDIAPHPLYTTVRASTPGLDFAGQLTGAIDDLERLIDPTT